MSDVLDPAIAALVEAINAGDTEAFVASFSADGQIDDWGRILRGADGVREWARTDAIGRNAQMSVVDVVVAGDVTTVHFDWTSDRFNGRSKAHVTVVEGKVATFMIPSE